MSSEVCVWDGVGPQNPMFKALCSCMECQCMLYSHLFLYSFPAHTKSQNKVCSDEVQKYGASIKAKSNKVQCLNHAVHKANENIHARCESNPFHIPRCEKTALHIPQC